MAFSFEPSQSELVVLLLGEKQSGKSSTGNFILGRQAFGINTTYSRTATSNVFGKQVTVVDTPGWLSDGSNTNRGVSAEVQRGLSLCKSQPDVLLLVLSVRAPFGPEQWGAFEAQLRTLQIPVWQSAMVLFTHGDCLEGMPIEEHIRRQGRTLQWLLDQCTNHYHVLTNQPGTSKSEVRELFEKMQRFVASSRRPAGGYMRRRVSRRQERSSLGNHEWIEMMQISNGYDFPDSIDQYQRQRQQRSAASFNQPRALTSDRAFSKRPLSLVLLGRRKSGKSTVGNLILTRKEFKTDTKTTHCSVGQGVVFGCSVIVVDTPGWSLYGLANPEKVKIEISQSPSLCLTGSKMLYLLTIPVDSFKEKDRKAVETYLGVLGDDLWTRVMVLFTFGDELRGKTVEKHVMKQGPALQWVMERCGYRHHVIETKIRDNSDQVVQLLEMAQRM